MKMADTLAALVAKRHPRSLEEYDQSLREVIQQFILLALWRGKFFNEAAFYGGTALRLFHGLDRFSEDLDFTLLAPSLGFRFDPWFEYIKKELAAQGLEVKIENSKKARTIQPAFLRTETKKALLIVGVADKLAAAVPSNKLIKIKFEADTEPPLGFTTENKFLLEPIPFSVKVLTPESLFAGKFHAILEREWKQRVKGRDWYDLVFFVRNNIPVKLDYLSKKLRAFNEQSKSLGYDPNIPLSNDRAISMLEQRIQQVNVESAKNEVYPFVEDKNQLNLWSQEFFLDIAHHIRFA